MYSKNYNGNYRMNNIRKLFEESIEVKSKILDSDSLMILEKMGNVIKHAVQQGNKLMLCGNGGSAADAQHLAAEFLIRLRSSNNREGIPAIALAQDTSTITACGNDFGYDVMYERMVNTLGNAGDVLIGITTSGNSENVIRAMKAANTMKIPVFGFLGSGGGRAIEICDEAFIVPSENTGRIQESHITAGHALMEYVEDKLIEDGYLHLEKN
jgi:D-sedoheptulose 7-phosphate isomerase